MQKFQCVDNLLHQEHNYLTDPRHVYLEHVYLELLKKPVTTDNVRTGVIHDIPS